MFKVYGKEVIKHPGTVPRPIFKEMEKRRGNYKSKDSYCDILEGALTVVLALLLTALVLVPLVCLFNKLLG